MVNRLPVWLFLSTSMLLIGAALLPLIRKSLAIDDIIEIQFLTVVMLLIGGLMAGLSAMILMVRRQAKVIKYISGNSPKAVITKLHLCGLLIFTGIPLANFLAAYWLWIHYRHFSEQINAQGIEVLNFQITIYLYLLLSLFLVFAVIGVFFIPLLLLIHLILTLIAIYISLAGREFLYPLNIPIIQGRASKESA